MKYFLRYTDTASEDLDRGTSVNASDLDVNEITKENAASMFGCEESEIKDVDGSWYQILDGICGYELEASTIEEAIEEVEEGSFQFDFVGKAIIFEGKESDSSLVADGDLFTPLSIVLEF